MVKHNDVFVDVRPFFGLNERTAYIYKERTYGGGWEQFTTDYGDYVCGYRKPNYPVPAIRYEADIYPANIRVWEWKQGEGWVQVRKYSKK